MANRKKPQFSYTPGKKIKSPGLRRNPSFIGVIIVLAMFLIFLFGRENLFSNNFDISGEFAVHFIDIGQGDSILIQNSDNEFMLIDAGENSQYSKLSSYLEQHGVREFKYVIFTHPHADHIGAAHRIVREYNIDKLIMPSVYHDTVTFRNLMDALDEKGMGITRAEAGDNYKFGDAEFLILAPFSEEYNNLNNYSVVILMNHGNNRFLFTGDMERESENEVIRHCQTNNFNIRADVLKVSHHGSSSSSQAALLDLIRPKLSVIQVGEGNSHNHPNLQVIGRLEDTGSEIIRTDWHGDIIILSNGRNLSVRTSKGDYDGRFADALEEELEQDGDKKGETE